MGVDSVGVVDLDVAGDLMVTRGPRPGFGGLHEGSPDTTTTQIGLDVPTLDERHG